MDMLDNSKMHRLHHPSTHKQAATTLNNNFCNSTHGGNIMSEVELASEIMKQGDPSMEPWRALELAKRFNNE